MTPAELRTEIKTGPHAATLAPHVASGNDQAITDFLNDKSGPGSAPITLAAIPRQRILRVFLKVATDLDSKTAALKSKWDRILPFVRDMEDTPLAVINDVLALAVTDGLLTAAKADNIRQRAGSRCEVVWGEGKTVLATDVARALRNADGTPIP